MDAVNKQVLGGYRVNPANGRGGGGGGKGEVAVDNKIWIMLCFISVHCGGRCQADGDGGMGWEAWQVVGDIAIPRVKAHARVLVCGEEGGGQGLP